MCTHSQPSSQEHLFDIATIGAGLPFVSACARLAETILANDVVVQAPPGTGKTTLVPPTVANAFPGEKIIVTAPRRVAVRAAARRLAQLTGTKLGEIIGFTIRGESRTSRNTVIEFVTPGVLLRRLLRDGDISARVVILDEVHERGLDTDMALAMLRDLRDIREDLRIIAMSATVDAQRFAELLDAPIVAAEAPIYPIDMRYRPARGPRLDARGVTNEFLEHVADETMALVDDAQLDGSSILVFLPGVREVERCAGMIEERVRTRAGSEEAEINVLQLHGRQSSKEQDTVFNVAGPSAESSSRRIIVSTAIAESSVTVPGVRAVVDACLSRGPRLDVVRGFSGLITTSCARSSADQRAGRAGREGPGVVVRCVSATDFQSFPEWPSPEMEVADLTQVMLDAAAWGTPGCEGLPLLTPPPAHHRDAAIELLENLGALDNGSITDLGRTLSTMPVEPRLGRAALIAATIVPGHKIAKAIEELSDARIERFIRNVELDSDTPINASSPAEITALVAALAWPDFIGRKRSGTRSDNASNGGGRRTTDFLFTGGTAATALDAGAYLHSEWIVATDLSRRQASRNSSTGATIRTAYPISEDLALYAAAAMHHSERAISIVNSRVTVRERDLLGAIELSSQPDRPTDAECISAWQDWLAFKPERLNELPWQDSAILLRQRLDLLHRELGAPWPDVSDKALIASPIFDEFSPTLATVNAPTVTAELLRQLLPWPEATRLDELVPERITMPSGRSFRVDYSVDPPVLAVKLQETFGLGTTPSLLDGQLPVVLHLLSPAQRPLAVTQDLVSFFAGPYAQVRSEMRGRYPKHNWPEDPRNSEGR